MSLQVLVLHDPDPDSPRLNWQAKPLVSPLPHSIITTDVVLAEPNVMTQDDFAGVDAFLLGKKFDGNGNLVAMTAQEAQDQLDTIAAMADPEEGQILTPREFMGRFAQATKDAIYTAALTDAVVMQVKDDLIAATHVDLKDPDVAAGLDVLISKGLLTAGEKTTLLTITPPA